MRIDEPQVVNDVHSRLNPTRVRGIIRPDNLDDLIAAVRQAAERGIVVCVCGGRHAMGAQQFATDALLIDMTALDRPIAMDAEKGLLEIEAGAQWPAIIHATHDLQRGESKRWGIRQKQTGADRLTLGGAVSANVHGRGLLMCPFVDDVESLRLVMADGQILHCSRQDSPELFSLVCGGYGLFGIIMSVKLRLGPRMKLRRIVDILDIDEAISAVRRRVDQGCLYGDFQYAIDPSEDGFLRRGVCACYQPVPEDVPVSDESADLSEDDWARLLRLAHTDKRQAFSLYSAHYLSTHGRVYWSDTMQLSTYIPSYDQFLKDVMSETAPESLVIGEIYVPPDALPAFLAASRGVLRESGVEDIYGTIRSIQRDTATFLPWARDDYACVIFNLRTRHDRAALDRTAGTFYDLQSAAIALGGSFYLTYHRFTDRRQIEACYPMLPRFLELKRQYDPEERFTSDWYRHVKRMFQ